VTGAGRARASEFAPVDLKIRRGPAEHALAEYYRTASETTGYPSYELVAVILNAARTR